ncbi:hypothetical protein [Algibacter sp. 2305UL17-15]|uniref:hypothetical protein n=1 Tax=Algibacter sp. 2305UL17-15 TaxID=3231268 RepID=UPI003457BFA1
MKTILFSYKFIFIIFTTLPLAMCSNDDNTEEENPFQPVTINLDGLNIDTDDTSFVVDGFQFKATRVKSQSGGILLAYPNQASDFSVLELDLTKSIGVSKISISLFNNCSGCLDIQILNGNQIVTEVKGTELESGENLVEIDINTNVSALRIGSLETIIYTIKLE